MSYTFLGAVCPPKYQTKKEEDNFVTVYCVLNSGEIKKISDPKGLKSNIINSKDVKFSTEQNTNDSLCFCEDLKDAKTYRNLLMEDPEQNSEGQTAFNLVAVQFDKNILNGTNAAVYYKENFSRFPNNPYNDPSNAYFMDVIILGKDTLKEGKILGIVENGEIKPLETTTAVDEPCSSEEENFQ